MRLRRLESVGLEDVATPEELVDPGHRPRARRHDLPGRRPPWESASFGGTGRHPCHRSARRLHRPEGCPLQTTHSDPVASRIPALDLSVTLSSLGLNPTTPSRCRPTSSSQDGSAWAPTPGQIGSAVILGHVDSTKGPAVFFGLRTLVPGDQVMVSLADGVTAEFRGDLGRHVLKVFLPGSIGLRIAWVRCSSTGDMWRDLRRPDGSLSVKHRRVHVAGRDRPGCSLRRAEFLTGGVPAPSRRSQRRNEMDQLSASRAKSASAQGKPDDNKGRLL